MLQPAYHHRGNTGSMNNQITSTFKSIKIQRDIKCLISL